MNDDRPATLHDRILADVRDNIVRGIWPVSYTHLSYMSLLGVYPADPLRHQITGG